STSRSYAPRYHFFLPLSSPSNSNYNSAAVVTNPPLPSSYSTTTELQKFRERVGRAISCESNASALGHLAQTHCERLPRLDRRIDRLVRRLLADQILRVECPKRCSDRRPDTDDAFFQVWPK